MPWRCYALFCRGAAARSRFFGPKQVSIRSVPAAEVRRPWSVATAVICGTQSWQPSNWFLRAGRKRRNLLRSLPGHERDPCSSWGHLTTSLSGVKSILDRGGVTPDDTSSYVFNIFIVQQTIKARPTPATTRPRRRTSASSTRPAPPRHLASTGDRCSPTLELQSCPRGTTWERRAAGSERIKKRTRLLVKVPRARAGISRTRRRVARPVPSSRSSSLLNANHRFAKATPRPCRTGRCSRLLRRHGSPRGRIRRRRRGSGGGSLVEMFVGWFNSVKLFTTSIVTTNNQSSPNAGDDASSTANVRVFDPTCSSASPSEYGRPL